ncbi:MAG: DUF6159 family protein [Thermoplasmata archaeon]|nr:DUF6159 family protein [Thermoplasmata archaeon]
MGAFGRSWKMTKLSLGVIRKDKELLLLPIISAIVMVLLVVSVVAPITYFGALDNPGSVGAYLALYFLLAFISIYFNVCIIAIANIRLRGGNPTIKDGFAVANRHLGSIVKWALISATVGLLLRALRNYLEREAGFLGSIFAWVAETSWALLTFFMVPVLIFEERPMREAFARSGELFKKTWGETFVSGFFLGIVFLLFFLGALVPLAIGVYLILSGSVLIGAIILIIGVSLMVIIGSMWVAAQGVLVAALYIYATEKIIPDGFEGAKFAA